MLLFYQPEIGQPVHTLDQEESKHISRVLRMRAGDLLHLTDGKGMLCEARIVDEHPKRCTVEILQVGQQSTRGSGHLHLAVAPTKNISRFEWFLEKATEIGVDEITPLLCDNSERTIIKTSRLQKVLIAAMKQSLKTFLPRLNEPVRFDRFIAASRVERKFIAWISDDPKELLKSSLSKGEDCLVMIGPEGDFTLREVELATKLGYEPVSLGTSRLRTETAAVVACHTVYLINE